MNPRISTSSSGQKPQGSQPQMATLNMLDPASYCSPYRHQLGQQQISSRLSAQQQYIPARTGFIQTIGPIARRPCDIDNSNAYKHLNVAQPYGTQLSQQQQRSPCPSILGQIVPVVTSKNWNTVYSTGSSGGTSSRLTLSPNLHSPATHTSQATPLSPGPGPLAWREQQDIHAEASRKAQESFGFRCQEQGCGEEFKLASHLRAHTRWHKGSEGYVCCWPGCKLRFGADSTLRIHMRTHTREKPYRCQTCDMGFSRSSYLGIHTSLHGTQGNLVTRGTQNQETTHSGTTDVTATEEGDSNEN